MRPRKAPLHNPSKVVCLSNAFIFIRLRTLLRNGANSTPLSSIVSALFPMQWGVEGILVGFAASHERLTHRRPLLFSTTYALPNLQALCFHDIATVPGGVCLLPSVQSGPHYKHYKSEVPRRSRLTVNWAARAASPTGGGAGARQPIEERRARHVVPLRKN